MRGLISGVVHTTAKAASRISRAAVSPRPNRQASGRGSAIGGGRGRELARPTTHAVDVTVRRRSLVERDPDRDVLLPQSRRLVAEAVGLHQARPRHTEGQGTVDPQKQPVRDGQTGTSGPTNVHHRLSRHFQPVENQLDRARRIGRGQLDATPRTPRTVHRIHQESDGSLGAVS